MPTAFSAPSRLEWHKYEQSSMAKQDQFLRKHEDEFKKTPVTNSDIIQVGDHLVLERKYYEHHMLCTFSGDNHVIVIHYTGPKAISRLSKVGVKGEIMEQMYLFKDLVEQKVQKIIWPDKLKRFSAEEVIERAFLRLRNNNYHVLKNNCQHFVTWSMCGLHVSLQVKQWYLKALQIGYSKDKAIAIAKELTKAKEKAIAEE